jgi:hypothetical protein
VFQHVCKNKKKRLINTEGHAVLPFIVFCSSFLATENQPLLLCFFISNNITYANNKIKKLKLSIIDTVYQNTQS